MPSRNVRKIDVGESFYHVYARGVSRQKLFLDAADYAYFLQLFARYLSVHKVIGKHGVVYPHYRDRVELLAYCCMTNHFHLLLYQAAAGDMRAFMQSLMTSYSMYFNRKYRRSGPVFESRYKASRIDSDIYLQHISRYIHLNPRRWRTYRQSSLRYYLNADAPEWLQTQRVTALFADAEAYLSFLEDYEQERDMLEELKYQLAHT